MKYIFIINPTAGSSDISDRISVYIDKYFKNKDFRYKIYLTSYPKEAIKIVKQEAEQGMDLRIFGFGGDGTLAELAEAAKIYKNVEIGIFPIGSGNDYIKNYGSVKSFSDFEKQIHGRSIEVDTIDTDSHTCLNICSVGLDAKVAYNMAKYKKIPFVSGPMAYNLSLTSALLKKVGHKIKVRIHTKNGVEEFDDNFMFVLAASGICYGAGYYGAPQAITNDELLDFVLIKKIPHRKIPSMVKIYKDGEHLTHPKFKDYLIYKRGYQMDISSKEKFYCNYDGDCEVRTSNSYKLGKYKIRFILPKGVKYDKY